LGKYKITNAIVIIDEASMELDARDFKNFLKNLKLFFTHHRKFKTRVLVISQHPDDIDIKIRRLTHRLFLVTPTLLFNMIKVKEITTFIGIDENKEARVMTIENNTFFIASLFQPQLSSTYENPHPLIIEYVNSARNFKSNK
jgi:CTP synthase (UTP-ammonia lyase)